jgi:Bacterial regulatory proteins, luxR family
MIDVIPGGDQRPGQHDVSVPGARCAARLPRTAHVRFSGATNLTTPEIARQLSVSRNPVKTHIRHLCAKFGAHLRAEAVDLARALGLLASARTDPASRQALTAAGQS